MPGHQWVDVSLEPCWIPLASGEDGFTAVFIWVPQGEYVGLCSPFCRNPRLKVMGIASVQSKAMKMRFS